MLERDNFRVISAGKTMVADADHMTSAHEDCTDHRIRTSSAGAFERQPISPAHVEFVSSARVQVGQRCYSLFCRDSAALEGGRPLRSFNSSSSSTMNSLMSLKERYTEAKRT
jgi:hypothetical protein